MISKTCVSHGICRCTPRQDAEVGHEGEVGQGRRERCLIRRDDVSSLSLPVAVRSRLSETQGDALSFRRDTNSGSEMRESQRMLQSVHI